MGANRIGAMLMMASMGCFAFNDMFVKFIGQDIPLFQLLFVRGLIATSLILGAAHYTRALDFKMAWGDWGLVVLRCIGELGAAYFFITALFHLPLANVTAILQMLPLTVSLGGALFFGERLGWRRIGAILVGFLGMLLIVRPGASDFNTFTLYGLAAVGFVTLRDLSTRRLSKNVSSMTVTFMASLVVTSFAGAATLLEPWAPVSMDHFGQILGSAVCIVAGYYLSVRVMRIGEIAFVALFRYTSLIWALLIGWALFSEWPDALTMLGAGIVVATGMFTLYREGRNKAEQQV